MFDSINPLKHWYWTTGYNSKEQIVLLGPYDTLEEAEKYRDMLHNGKVHELKTWDKDAARLQIKHRLLDSTRNIDTATSRMRHKIDTPDANFGVGGNDDMQEDYNF